MPCHPSRQFVILKFLQSDARGEHEHAKSRTKGAETMGVNEEGRKGRGERGRSEHLRRNKGPTHPPSERERGSEPQQLARLLPDSFCRAGLPCLFPPSLPPSLSPSLPSFLPGTSHKMLAAYQVNDLAAAVERGGGKRTLPSLHPKGGRVSITKLLLWLHRMGELDSFPEKQSSGRANQHNMFSTK